MKPFGVRLAAGAITILLGALAAAQAQKDRQKDPNSTWTVADTAVLNTPPAPITAMGDRSWSLDPTEFSGPADLAASSKSAQKFPAGPMDAIQQVQHTEPLEADSPALPAQDSALPAQDAVSPPQGFGSFPSFGDAPATGFSTPPTVSTRETVVDAAPPSGFGGFDVSQLPTSLAAQPPVSDPTSAAAGWGMPPAPASSVPAAIASTQNAMPSMTMGNATIDSPVMPELQFDEPPSFAADPQYDDVPALTAPDAASQGFGSANVLRGSTSELQAESALTSPPSAFAAVPQAPSFQSAPAFQPASSSMQLPGNSALAPSSPRIASLPSAPAQNFAPASTFAESPGLASSQVPFRSEPSQTINSPGDRRLEGVQSPSVVIHKRAPIEVKVGKPAAFVIHVQNVGSAEALDVRVHDRVPAGMRLVDASPAPVVQGDSMLWQLGAMPVGDERTITMQLVPEAEGELGSVARVTFEAAASVRTMSTRPQLSIVQRAPEKVLIGQQLEVELEVSNPGTGDALGVVLQADVPDGLEHPKGRELDNLLGTLRAGEVRRQVLRLRAVAPGRIQNIVRLTSEDGITAEHVIEVEVIAPDLHVELTGPSRRFLERQATYQLDLSNVGTADATNVEVAAYLDRGFTFVSTANEGQYDPSRHAVYWSLPQLPEGGRGQVPLTLLPVEEGERTIRLEARGDLGLTANSERHVTVESLAELTFQISDAADPIEIDSETTYEIRLTNRGSRSDSNVQVKFQLPAGLQLVSTETDAGTDDRGLVAFAPQSKLDSGQELVYRIRVKGVAPGTHLTRAIVVSDQSTVPVTKEESTMVYSDR